jgi:peptidyl-prolyl cis-trans isomerase D
MHCYNGSTKEERVAMLRKMRQSAQGFVAKLIIGLLIASFAVWGVTDFASTRTQNILATVGEEPVTAAEYEEAINLLRRNFGENYRPELMHSLNLYRLTLEDIIKRRLVLQEARALDLRITEEALADAVRTTPQFQNTVGEFDKLIFQQTLRQSNLTEAYFLEKLRNQLLSELVVNSVDGRAVIPDGYAEILYSIRNEERAVDLYRINVQDDIQIPQPDESDLIAYYDQHKQKFTAPEYRSFEYIHIAPEDIYKKVDIDDEELRKLYKERSGNYMIPEKRDVSQLLYEDKAKAEQAFALLRSGENLKKTATKIPPVSGEIQHLEYVTQEQLPAGSDQIFSLETDEFTAPIESPFGWHVFYVHDIQQAKVSPYEEIRPILEREFTQQKAEIILLETVEQVEDALAANRDMNEIAAAAGVTVQSSGPVDLSGQRNDNRQTLSSPEDEEILKTAFELAPDSRSRLKRLEEGGYYIVELKNVVPPRQRTIDEVRGQLIDAWRKEMRIESMKQKASEVLYTTKASTDIPGFDEAVSQNEEISPVGSITLRRQQKLGDMTSTIPPAMHDAIYSHDTSTLPAITKPFATKQKGKFLVAMIRGANRPKTAESKEAKQQLEVMKEELRQRYNAEVFDQYLDYLRTKFPVSINEELFAAMTQPQNL